LREVQLPRAYVFRADDSYRQGPVGLALGPEADTADIQNFVEHVLHKESNQTSRYVSFAEVLTIARKFTTAPDNRHIRKVALASLQNLASEGTIVIWEPESVFETLARSAKKLARWAGDVQATMRRNRELLIEGQIPAELLKRVK
jgi:hypothetical protein